jgi:hypothetical protein
LEKILYLDYDGVMHDDAVYWHPTRGIYLDTPGRILFEWMPILEDLLAPHTDVSIVLSTSWVRAKSFEFAKNKLSTSLQEKVIGATFHNRLMQKFDFDNQSRGYQIWNDVLRRKPAAWFAIDNDDAQWPEHCRDRLVLTDDRLGLSDVRVQDAIRDMLLAW